MCTSSLWTRFLVCFEWVMSHIQGKLFCVIEWGIAKIYEMSNTLYVYIHMFIHLYIRTYIHIYECIYVWHTWEIDASQLFTKKPCHTLTVRITHSKFFSNAHRCIPVFVLSIPSFPRGGGRVRVGYLSFNFGPSRNSHNFYFFVDILFYMSCMFECVCECVCVWMCVCVCVCVSSCFIWAVCCQSAYMIKTCIVFQPYIAQTF